MTMTTCDNLHDTADLGLSRTAETASRHMAVGASWAMRLLLDFEGMLDRASERRAMRDLDAHTLKDIGLSAADVELEARKPFWR